MCKCVVTNTNFFFACYIFTLLVIYNIVGRYHHCYWNYPVHLQLRSNIRTSKHCLSIWFLVHFHTYVQLQLRMHHFCICTYAFIITKYRVLHILCVCMYTCAYICTYVCCCECTYMYVCVNVYVYVSMYVNKCFGHMLFPSPERNTTVCG